MGGKGVESTRNEQRDKGNEYEGLLKDGPQMIRARHVTRMHAHVCTCVYQVCVCGREYLCQARLYFRTALLAHLDFVLFCMSNLNSFQQQQPQTPQMVNFKCV